MLELAKIGSKRIKNYIITKKMFFFFENIIKENTFEQSLKLKFIYPLKFM